MKALIKYLVVATAAIGMIACNRPFSKYVENGETDLSKRGYKGPVKQVEICQNGETTFVTKYNKYGFITEETEHPGEANESTTTFHYNEYGKLSKYEEATGTYRATHYYIYDGQSNFIMEVRERISLNASEAVTRDTIAICECKYDDEGRLLYTKLSTAKGDVIEKYFSNFGKPVKVIASYMGEVEQEVDTIYYTYQDDVLVCKVRYSGYSGYPLVDSTIYHENGSEAHDVQYGGGLLCREVEYSYIEGRLREKTEFLRDEMETETITEKWDYDDHGSTTEWSCLRQYFRQNSSPYDTISFHNKFEYEYDEKGNVIYWKNDSGDETHYIFSYYE